MIFHCKDDPITLDDVIVADEIIKNENILVASTEYGSHLSSRESFLEMKQWFTKPIFTFLENYWEPLDKTC